MVRAKYGKPLGWRKIMKATRDHYKALWPEGLR